MNLHLSLAQEDVVAAPGYQLAGAGLGLPQRAHQHLHRHRATLCSPVAELHNNSQLEGSSLISI